MVNPMTTTGCNGSFPKMAMSCVYYSCSLPRIIYQIFVHSQYDSMTLSWAYPQTLSWQSNLEVFVPQDPFVWYYYLPNISKHLCIIYCIIITQFVCLNHIRHKQSTKKAGKYTHPRILCFFLVFLGHLETIFSLLWKHDF